MATFSRREQRTGARKFYINGRFYSQQLSGVQRYGRELVVALDRQIALQPDENESWTVVTSGDGADFPRLSRISRLDLPAPIGGHLWEQFVLSRASSDGVLVNLGNTGALWREDQLCVIHDMAAFRHPKMFSRVYGAWHRFLGRHLARRARLGTVSSFSRDEIADIFDLVPCKVAILPNGCDHMQGGDVDGRIVERLGLLDRPFFIVLGNQSAHKNVAIASDAIRQVPEARLVIVGGSQNHVFGEMTEMDPQPNVIRAGRLEDEEVRGLLKKARGLVFPSMYEGCGIPPLEALATGCTVLSSDIPPVRENCGDAALYFDAKDADALAGLMSKVLAEDETSRAARQRLGWARTKSLRWEETARRLLEVCRSWDDAER